MKVEILSIDQVYLLSSDTLQDFVTLQLPNGVQVRAVLENGQSDVIIKCVQEQNQAAEEPAEEAALLEEQPAEQAPTPTVRWIDLPDETLPERFKRALLSLGVSTVLEPVALSRLVIDISNQFTEADWENVLGATQDVEVEPAVEVTPVAPPPAPSGPARGEVQWVNAVVHQSKPARTVPKDEYGYPIVSKAGLDPSAVLGNSRHADEDGVSQL